MGMVEGVPKQVLNDCVFRDISQRTFDMTLKGVVYDE